MVRITEPEALTTESFPPSLMLPALKYNAGMKTLEHLGRYAYFVSQSFLALFSAPLQPGECLRQFHSILLGALPLGFIAGGALGVVVWIHLHGVISPDLVRKVPEYLAMAVVLEFAPLGAGLVVAGRNGASLGAELSSMKISEQIDALEVLGLSPIRHLVGPRVLACMIALPILTVFIAAVAIASSGLAEVVGGSLSWTLYENDIFRGLAQVNGVAAIFKTVVFGFLVGVTGCYCGMFADGGTEGVGRAATQGVVGSTLWVLVSNVFLVKLIQLLG